MHSVDGESAQDPATVFPPKPSTLEDCHRVIDAMGIELAQLRRRMHQTIPEQGRWLRAVVMGFNAYHAVPTNLRAIAVFRYHVTDLWRRTLRRRSQKDRVTWERMTKIAAAWLPKPRILHPWPDARFAVNHPRWEPSA